MVAKIGKIIISIILSLVVSIATGVLLAWLGGYIVGYTVDSSGNEVLNGGSMTALTIFTICFATSLAFGVWFYKYVHLGKKSEAKE
jgi:NhaP-type Na+/H+ or K+/H+ antiporter